MSSQEPIDVIRTTRPVTAFYDAVSVLRSTLSLGIAAVLILGVSGLVEYLSASRAPIEDILILGFVSAILIPVGWIVFYGTLRHRHDGVATHTRHAIRQLTARYPAYAGAHLLSEVLFWGVSAVIGLGVLPISMFIAGYATPDVMIALQGTPPTENVSLVVYSTVVLTGLSALLLMYYIQFYTMEALFNDAGPIGALRNSKDLVSRNHRAVFGYSIIQALPPIVTILAAGSASLFPDLASMGSILSVGVIIALALLGGGLLLALTAFAGVYQYTFYKRIAG